MYLFYLNPICSLKQCFFVRSTMFNFTVLTDAVSSDGNSLFSCGGEGSVMIHSMHNLQNKARDMNAIIRKTNNIKVSHKPQLHIKISSKPTQLKRIFPVFKRYTYLFFNMALSSKLYIYTYIYSLC